jgi:hypothetical protein
MMFENALSAKIPVLGVTTDDLMNFEEALHLIAKMTVKELPKNVKALGDALYWTMDVEDVTLDVYKFLMKHEHQLVVINPSKKNPLVFDAGELPTPKEMILGYLEEVMEADQVEQTYTALKGLSLKAVSEIVMLTQARTGSMSIKEIRRTRSMLGGTVQGLIPVEPDFDFYKFPVKIEEWLKINRAYFLSEKTPPKLRPRGVMLEGSPGVGKSMAAKAIARELGVPLYRLDIATTLNRYIGESEARVARSLSLLEREAPCVMLLDEVEKHFTDKEDSGVVTRIMSQLLWWLADHSSRVLTVMTTNNLSHIPPELYRTGRVDMVMKIPRMSTMEANNFAQEVFASVVGKKATLKQVQTLANALKLTEKDDFAHAEVAELVYTQIKQHEWVVV